MATRSRKRKLDSEGARFSSPKKKERMDEICKGYVPPNTKKATSWAVGVLKAWREERNSRSVEECPDRLLEEPSQQELNYWLSRFVVEVRRADRKPYPPTSIVNILSGLYRYAKECDCSCPNFMNRKDVAFKELNGALSVLFRELREAGVGATVKHAPVVTSDEEDALWESKVIGDHGPRELQRAVFFYVGKMFCLRGGEEQRALKRSQFVRSYNPDSYTYIENGSKNRSGVNLKENNKIVPVFSSPHSRPRCLVYLLDLYLSKLPVGSKEKDTFYLRPVSKKPTESSAPWYECAPLGKEKLRKMLSTMCCEAGIYEAKTNHSLRATGATALFNANVPEKMIRDVTGHRSNALDLYERPSQSQKESVSRILVQGEKTFSVKDTDGGISGTKPTVPSAGNVLGNVFSGLTNCSINIAPKNLVIQVGLSHSQAHSSDFRYLFEGVDMEDFAASD